MNKRRLFLEYLNNLIQTNLWFKNYLARSNSSHEWLFVFLKYLMFGCQLLNFWLNGFSKKIRKGTKLCDINIEEPELKFDLLVGKVILPDKTAQVTLPEPKLEEPGFNYLGDGTKFLWFDETIHRFYQGIIQPKKGIYLFDRSIKVIHYSICHFV